MKSSYSDTAYVDIKIKVLSANAGVTSRRVNLHLPRVINRNAKKYFKLRPRLRFGEINIAAGRDAMALSAIRGDSFAKIKDHNVDKFASELAEIEASHYQQSTRTKALLRGVKAKQNWLSQLGGSLSTQEMADTLGVTAKTINKKRTDGELLGLPVANSYVYPVWQLDNEQKILSGLKAVLDSLQASTSINSDWTKLKFFVEPNQYLRANNKTTDAFIPAQALQQGLVGDVVKAANNYLQHGAN